MDKQLFDDAIGEAPPSTVNVDAVITRGRRADRIRRVANPAVAAGVAVVLAVGVIAYTMTRGDDGGAGVRVGGQTPTPGTSTSPGGPATSETKLPTSGLPEACSRPHLETGAQVIARLDPVLSAAAHAQLPSAQFETNPVNEYPDGVLHGALELFQVTGETPADKPICDVDTYFLARAVVRTPEGKGNFLIAVQPAYNGGGVGMSCPPPGSTGGEQTSCEEVTTPEGHRVLKETLALEGGTTMNKVSIVRADGTSVNVESADIDTDVKTAGAPTSPTPPLTLDQLIAIGTDPGMTLFP